MSIFDKKIGKSTGIWRVISWGHAKLSDIMVDGSEVYKEFSTDEIEINGDRASKLGQIFASFEDILRDIEPYADRIVGFNFEMGGSPRMW